MDKQRLATRIWQTANRMRSQIEANEYKDYILGLIFYKFLSDNEEHYLRKNGWTDEDIVKLDEENPKMSAMIAGIKNDLGYCITYNNLFSTWLKKGQQFTFGDITDALNAFNRLTGNKKIFGGIFKTLNLGLQKLSGTDRQRASAIRDILQLIRDIPTDSPNYDVLGYVYEYLIGNFAANAGKKAGEFYTPHEVSLLMAEIVAHHMKGRDSADIYDPTSGSGSLLLNIGSAVQRELGGTRRIRYFAQELKENTYNLTRMNLVMAGIIPENITVRNADTLADDWPWFDEVDPANTYQPLYVDAVVSNPPYSQEWKPLESDPRFDSFGVAPDKKADYAFLLHSLYHLKPDGIMTIVLPHGVLFRGASEGNIRENLVEGNHIDAIIGLASNIFFGTGISVIIMVLKKGRDEDDILFVDASEFFGKKGKDNFLRARDIKKILDTVANRKEVENFSRKVSRDVIRQNEYNLNIPRYVSSKKSSESWDMWSILNGGIPDQELAVFNPEWNVFAGLREHLFERLNADHWQSRNLDMEKEIDSYPAVNDFRHQHEQIFAALPYFLENELIGKYLTLEADKAKVLFSAEIFRLFEAIPLLDPYEFYGFFDEWWTDISKDLNTFRNEGKGAIRAVEPRMVIKKRGDEEIEEQDGWQGKILPFQLVQDVLLPAEKNEVVALAEKLEGFAEAFNELFHSILELMGEEEGDDEEQEEKEEDDDDNRTGPIFLNKKKTAFAKSNIAKALKDDSLDPAIIEILKEVKKLDKEEKSLKKEYRAKADALDQKTIQAIEDLDEEQATDLLRRKWIKPFMAELHTLPDKKIADFIDALKTLIQKYEDTLSAVDQEINSVETELCKMLNDLTGYETDMLAIADFKELLGDCNE